MDEIIIREAEYWCTLNNVDIENIDDEDLYQCITSIANALDLVEEDVEFVLNKYL